MIRRKAIHCVPIIKSWIRELNGEKVLLIASIITFFSILSSMREPHLIDVSALQKNKTIGGYKEKIRNFFGLPEEVQIPKQRIDTVALIDPQVIFTRGTVSDNEDKGRRISYNPFFPERSTPLISEQRAEEIMIEKEEQVFIGILNLIGNKDKLSVILKGAKSGQYKTLLEGDIWDGIQIIAINPGAARIMNRKGQIQDFTTIPDRTTIK